MTPRGRRPRTAVACLSCALLLATLPLAACGGRRAATTPTRPATPAGATTPDTPATPSTPAPVSPALARLHRDIDTILGAPEFEPGTWGVVVRSLRTNEMLYARNARKLLAPASNLKIVTLAAAAEKLGWDYTYRTEVLGLGAIDFGFLDGDLIVRGTGDPSLVEDGGMAEQVFRAWADRLKALGVRSLSGRIIGDDSAFDDDAYGSGWMWDDMQEAYSAGIGALQYNLGETRIAVTPADHAGSPASVAIATEGSGLVLRNRVTTGEAASAARVVTRRIANTNILEVAGAVPAGGAPVHERVSVDNQTLYFVTELRRALIANGIDVRGPAVDIDDLPSPPPVQDAVPLVSHRSPPLSSLADTLMKLSQNQYAETFLKTLGAQAGTPTFEGGRQVITDVLKSWGLDASHLQQADGSGLSRYDVMSPELLTGVLAHVAQDAKLDGPFRAALAVAGTPGLLSNRLKGTAAAGQVQAKTGSMRHVRSTSGYTRTADGEPVAFSIIVNNYGIASSEVDRASDAIILRVFEFRR